MSHSENEEQIQTLKTFFAKKGKFLLIIIILVLIGFFGWRYWQSYQIEKQTAASDKYEYLISKLDETDPSSADELVAFAKENDSIYAVFSDLKAAQFYVQVKKDYDGAKNLLKHAIKKTDSEPVLAMIQLRIARLELQLGQYEDSLNSLTLIKNNNWDAVVNDIRGDVYSKTGKYNEAVNAYEVVLASNPDQELEKNVKIKLNEVQYLKVKKDTEKNEATN